MTDHDRFSYPPIPKISGDLILETFTHKSLCDLLIVEQLPSQPEAGQDSNILQSQNAGDASLFRSKYSDNRRLAVVGDFALKLVVVNLLYQQTNISAGDLPAESDTILSSENLQKWVAFYRLRDKLRCAPNIQNLTTDEETRTIFNAYVGAVFLESGLPIVSDWISKLVHLATSADANVPTPDVDDSRPSKKAKSDLPIKEEERGSNYLIGQLVPQYSSSPTSPHAVSGAHQLPSSSSSRSNVHNLNSHSFLPSFNQKCAQNKLQVEYQAEFRGQPHSGQWEITCLVNGIVKGHGQGTSKQDAKEEAAKEAFYAMGWDKV